MWISSVSSGFARFRIPEGTRSGEHVQHAAGGLGAGEAGAGGCAESTGVLIVLMLGNLAVALHGLFHLGKGLLGSGQISRTKGRLEGLHGCGHLGGRGSSAIGGLRESLLILLESGESEFRGGKIAGLERGTNGLEILGALLPRALHGGLIGIRGRSQIMYLHDASLIFRLDSTSCSFLPACRRTWQILHAEMGIGRSAAGL